MIDYIKLARQAGIDVLEDAIERSIMWPATPEGLAKFAELVLEEAAKTCDERADYYKAGDDDKPEPRRYRASKACAAAIRAMKPNTASYALQER